MATSQLRWLRLEERGDTVNNDQRFEAPLYTASEVARYLSVPPSTFNSWINGYVRHRPEGRETNAAPVITVVHAGRGQPTMPFASLAEGMVLAGFRRAGVSLQHIRKAVSVLRDELGLEHVLASKKLFTDGAQILYDYARETDDREILTVVVTGQRVFQPVVNEYLKRISYDTLGWASRVVLPITKEPLIECDPERAFGQPLFIGNGAPMESVVRRFQAGEAIRAVARDFDLTSSVVEQVIRASLARAA